MSGSSEGSASDGFDTLLASVRRVVVRAASFSGRFLMSSVLREFSSRRGERLRWFVVFSGKGYGITVLEFHPFPRF